MRQLTHRLRRDAGLTMTELAVAVVLLSIIIAGLAPLMVNSLLSAQKTANSGEANRLVATHIDETRALVRGTSCAAAEALTTSDVIPAATDPTGPAAKLRIEREVKVTCADRLATVSVSVFPRETAETASSAGDAQSLSRATTKVVTGP